MLNDFGIQKTKGGASEKEEGYFLKSFVAKRIGYLCVITALCLVIVGLLTQQQLVAQRSQVNSANELIGRKQRTVDMKNTELLHKHKIIQEKEGELENYEELVATKQRNIDAKNQQLLEKHRLLQKSQEELKQGYELIAKKERTVNWKNELLQEKAKLAEQHKELSSGRKKEMFRIARLAQHTDQNLQAKLLKVLTALQGFLQREETWESIITISSQRTNAFIKTHKKAHDQIMTLLEGETGRKMDDAKKLLKEDTDNLEGTLQSVLQTQADEIIEEQKISEKRMKLVVQDILDELKHEVEQHGHRETEEQKLRDKHDPEFEEFEKDWTEEEEQGMHKLGKEVDNMHQFLTKFQSKIKTLKHMALTTNQIRKGHELLHSVTQGDIDYELGQTQMEGMMKDSGHIISWGSGGKGSLDLHPQFEEWLTTASFEPAMKQWDEDLESWAKGEKQDADLLLKFESDVADGTLHGGWAAKLMMDLLKETS